MLYYSYRLMIRQDEDNYILKCRQLLQQYVVDMYAKIESERLLFIRLNQTKLRSEQYIHLRDAVVNDGNTINVYRLITFITINVYKRYNCFKPFKSVLKRSKMI